MDTIKELKQAARERERIRSEGEAQIKAQQNARLDALRAHLRETSPIGAFACEMTKEIHGRIKVDFCIPNHATISTCFDDTLSGKWNQKPLQTEGYGRPFWRVETFAGTELDFDGTYIARFTTADFDDLGEALLAAERGYVAPEDIEREISDMNAKHATAKPVNEPTTGAQLLALLEKFVTETYAHSAPGE